jgi:hypothetical protein
MPQLLHRRRIQTRLGVTRSSLIFGQPRIVSNCQNTLFQIVRGRIQKGCVLRREANAQIVPKLGSQSTPLVLVLIWLPCEPGLVKLGPPRQFLCNCLQESSLQGSVRFG